jgi:hypothetical protein
MPSEKAKAFIILPSLFAHPDFLLGNVQTVSINPPSKALPKRVEVRASLFYHFE